MQRAKVQVKRVQRKFTQYKDQSPIYFMETFEHGKKTHYIISSNTWLYIGYMERTHFKLLSTYNIKSYVTSMCIDNQTIYLGQKNGSIIFATFSQIQNEIPFRTIESVDGKPIVGISVCTKQQSKQKEILAITGDNSFKLYERIEQNFRIVKNTEIQRTFSKVVSKSSENQNHPIFLIKLNQFTGYPILLTSKQFRSILFKQVKFEQLLLIRQKFYLDDQRPHTKITSMDFDLSKMKVSLGYLDGILQVLNIQSQTLQNSQFYAIISTLKIQLRQNLKSVSIHFTKDVHYISYITDSNISGINYQDLTNDFSKIRIENKQITAIKWSNDKYFLIAALSNSEVKKIPKVYCIEQQ